MTPADLHDNQTQSIPLDQLNAHPANSNVMHDHLLDGLTEHVRRTGRYPPLIVRPQADGYYQILDGHHRALALRRLDIDHARCVVWQADDHEALLLLATLNRLEGRDDPRKRAALVNALADRLDVKTLATLLPERIEQVKKLITINDRPPAPRPPQDPDRMPVAVHFFLLPDQKQRLNQRLKAIGGTREEALMKLIDINHEPVPDQQADNAR